MDGIGLCHEPLGGILICLTLIMQIIMRTQKNLQGFLLLGVTEK